MTDRRTRFDESGNVVCPEGVPADEWKSLSAEKQSCVQHKLPKLIAEGYKPDQAFAIAVSMCSRGTAKSVDGLGDVFGQVVAAATNGRAFSEA